jgi:hypothetical protein
MPCRSEEEPTAKGVLLHREWSFYVIETICFIMLFRRVAGKPLAELIYG